MGAVSYGQGGYVVVSMSVRAQAAYESGEMPMSKWTRDAIISAIKDYCADFDLAYNPKIETVSRAKLAETYLEYKSWHHTGRFARETEFFGLNEDAVCADFAEMTPDQIVERDEKAADWGMKPEQTCPVELAARSHVGCFNAFRDGIGGDTEWHDLDFDRVAELFDERGLDDLLEAKRDEAELSEDLGLVRESDCR